MTRTSQRILLVEDTETNTEMLKRRLKTRGYDVLVAVDGMQAVTMALEELPDLILMDLGLPVLDGWEATRRIKADESTKHIPIIALTAHAMHGDEERARASGCDAYETKPIELSSLLAKMHTLLPPCS